MRDCEGEGKIPRFAMWMGSDVNRSVFEGGTLVGDLPDCLPATCATSAALQDLSGTGKMLPSKSETSSSCPQEQSVS